MPEPVAVEAAGGIVFDADGRLLVVRRARPPEAGRWTVPGGKCRPGESPADACVREVAEETGVQVCVVRLAGTVRLTNPDRPGREYQVHDFVCVPERADGQPVAADDAADARWVTGAQLRELPTTTGLLTTLGEWRLLPR